MRDVVVGTAGHIDHGKTLLVKAMTGMDADRLEEEKRRGITLDIGFATLRTERGTLHFVDLPGHERFIKNMLAGATGIDLCLLVVAADESVMPQTVEHAEILQLLGVSRGVVALNKVDLVDEETLEIALLEVSEFLSAHGMGRLPVIPVSAASGQGVENLVDALYAQAGSCPAPPADRPFRLPVDRVFPVRGFGTVVTGTCVDGAVEQGAQVEVVPGAGQSRVRGIQIFGEEVRRAAAGQRAALNLPDLKHADLGRGQMAAAPGAVWPTHLLDVHLRVLPSSRVALKSGGTATLHLHTQEAEAHVHLRGLAHLAPGEAALAQLRMPELVTAWPGDRFILRLPSPARTVAGGEVLLVAKRKRRWQRARDAKVAGALERGKMLEALLAEAGPVGILAEEVAGRLGTAADNLGRPALQAEEAGTLKRWAGGRWWLDAAEAEAWLARATVWLKARHEARSPAALVPRQEIAGRYLRALGPMRAEALVEALLEAGRVEAEGDRVRLTGFTVTLTQAQKAAAEKVLARLGREGSPALTGGELEADAGAEARQVLPLLEGSGKVIRFGGDCFMAAETRALLREKLLEWTSNRGATIGVPDFKELLGLTRKYAMPLLEHLDDLRWTRREGDGRRILISAPPDGKR